MKKVTFLVAEQNTNMALRYADYGYIMERADVDGAASDRPTTKTLRSFTLGVGGAERKKLQDVRSYKAKRKRWLA
jgi:branched-chain amino acid transport system ATP-binding protein